jgi:flagellin
MFIAFSGVGAQRADPQKRVYLEKRMVEMPLSVNTNVGAMLALQNLNKTNMSMEATQLAITTGLRVSGPKQDASSYAIAQNMRGDISGLGAVKTALANGEATVNTAITAGQSISDMLTEMKAKVVQANQAGLDAASRTSLHNDFVSLRDQISTIVATAEFNGTNLVNSSASTTSVLSTVDGSTISVSAQKMDATTLAIQSQVLNTSAGAATALTAIDSAITSVSDKLAALGSVSKRIEVQGDFTTKLTDILKAGVGTLVDADLAEESAKLQSLQIKQQLGVQALSIANAGPQSILSLFG